MINALINCKYALLFAATWTLMNSVVSYFQYKLQPCTRTINQILFDIFPAQVKNHVDSHALWAQPLGVVSLRCHTNAAPTKHLQRCPTCSAQPNIILISPSLFLSPFEEYFSQHLGEYENVLAALEDLNMSILKAMDKTKKVRWISSNSRRRSPQRRKKKHGNRYNLDLLFVIY